MVFDNPRNCSGEIQLWSGDASSAARFACVGRLDVTAKGQDVLLAAFAGSLWLVRSQETVDDVSYMKAMIPHHSIAIMTSRRARITDPRVRNLANGIIDAQVREIGEMENLIAISRRKGVRTRAAWLETSSSS